VPAPSEIAFVRAVPRAGPKRDDLCTIPPIAAIGDETPTVPPLALTHPHV